MSVNSKVAELLKQGYKPTPEDEKAQRTCTNMFMTRFTLGSAVGVAAVAAVMSRYPALQKSMWRTPAYITSMMLGGQVGLGMMEQEKCVAAAMNVDSALGAALREQMRTEFPRAYERLPEELRSKRFEDYNWVPDPNYVPPGKKKRPQAPPLGIEVFKPPSLDELYDDDEVIPPPPRRTAPAVRDSVDEMDREVEAERRAAEKDRQRWAGDDRVRGARSNRDTRDSRDRYGESRATKPAAVPAEDDYRRPAWREASDRRRGGGDRDGDGGSGGPRRFFDEEQEQEARRTSSRRY
jgi:hypothetical protein